MSYWIPVAEYNPLRRKTGSRVLIRGPMGYGPDYIELGVYDFARKRWEVVNNGSYADSSLHLNYPCDGSEYGYAPPTYFCVIDLY